MSSVRLWYLLILLINKKYSTYCYSYGYGYGYGYECGYAYGCGYRCGYRYSYSYKYSYSCSYSYNYSKLVLFFMGIALHIQPSKFRIKFYVHKFTLFSII